MIPIYAALVAQVRLAYQFGRSFKVVGEDLSGNRFNCQLEDAIQRYIYTFGIWEPDITAFVRTRVNSGDTFIDVGANIGYYTMLASALVGSSGQVLAIEASPNIFVGLLKTIRMNGDPSNIRAINAAAADRIGELVVHRGPDENLGLTTTVKSRGLLEEASVSADKVGNLVGMDVFTNAKLIKIDVEGAELSVLQGIAKDIESLPEGAEIIVEFSPEWWEKGGTTPQTVLEPFLERGYSAYEISNNYWPWRYMWPRSTQKPQKLVDLSSLRHRRIDLVLSRTLHQLT